MVMKNRIMRIPYFLCCYLQTFVCVKIILNPHYTRNITPKHVTSGGIHLRGLAPEQHSCKQMSHRKRAVDGLTGPGIDPQTICKHPGGLDHLGLGPIFDTLPPFVSPSAQPLGCFGDINSGGTVAFRSS